LSVQAQDVKDLNSVFTCCQTHVSYPLLLLAKKTCATDKLS